MKVRMKNVPEELCSFCHQIKAAPGLRMSQETLGGHENERLTEGHEDLTAEDVEVVGGRAAVRHLK